MAPGPPDPGGRGRSGAPASQSRQPGHLRHRPEYQLHEHLHFRLPLLRLLPASRGRDGYVLAWDELAAKLTELKDHGGSGVLLQGGLNPELPLGYYLELVRFIRDFGLSVHGFSPPEIFYLANQNHLSLEDLLRRLIDAGLELHPRRRGRNPGGPGAAADSPQKCSSDPWLAVMAAAHRQGLSTSATMMFGHLETQAERLEHLFRIRDLQDETGGFTAFIPWTYQPGGTNLAGKTPGAVEYLKMLAISRLVLDNVPHLQVSWVTQGPKVAQVALKFGADDFGSTMWKKTWWPPPGWASI